MRFERWQQRYWRESVNGLIKVRVFYFQSVGFSFSHGFQATWMGIIICILIRDGNFPLKNGFPLKSILASSDFVFGISGSAIKKKKIGKTPSN